MRISIFASIAYLTAVAFIHCVIAAPTPRGLPPPRFPGTITFIKTDGVKLVSLTDSTGKFWPCDKETALIAEGIKVGDEVTFLKRLPASQTAHEVQKVWTDGKITFIRRQNPPLVTLTDRHGRNWPCDKEVALLAAGIKVGDAVKFKRREPATQTAFEVKKV